MFCMKMISEYIEVQKDVYACFIDYAKAFDKVLHSVLIESLESIGLDGKYTRLITNLYWEKTAAIRSNNYISTSINIKDTTRMYTLPVYIQFIHRHDLPRNTGNVRTMHRWNKYQ